jgi:hypothetical protein
MMIGTMIEFYDDPDAGPIATVHSAMVPPVKAKISIRGKTYEVAKVTYAVDYADHPISDRWMRANVDVKAAK